MYCVCVRFCSRTDLDRIEAAERDTHTLDALRTKMTIWQSTSATNFWKDNFVCASNIRVDRNNIYIHQSFRRGIHCRDVWGTMMPSYDIFWLDHHFAANECGFVYYMVEHDIWRPSIQLIICCVRIISVRSIMRESSDRPSFPAIEPRPNTRLSLPETSELPFPQNFDWIRAAPKQWKKIEWKSCKTLVGFLFCQRHIYMLSFPPVCRVHCCIKSNSVTVLTGITALRHFL